MTIDKIARLQRQPWKCNVLLLWPKCNIYVSSIMKDTLRCVPNLQWFLLANTSDSGSVLVRFLTWNGPRLLGNTNYEVSLCWSTSRNCWMYRQVTNCRLRKWTKLVRSGFSITSLVLYCMACHHRIAGRRMSRWCECWLNFVLLQMTTF